MNKKSIFEKIISREVPSEIIFQDSLVTAINDIFPKTPIHILIIPNFLIPSINYVELKHRKILGHMIYVSKIIAEKKCISKNGYRLVINCNEDAGQEIFYLHMHLLGGKKLSSIFY